MNIWLILRTFAAVFLVVFGIGLIFARLDDLRIMAGAVVAAIGFTFLIWLAIALRQR